MKKVEQIEWFEMNESGPLARGKYLVLIGFIEKGVYSRTYDVLVWKGDVMRWARLPGSYKGSQGWSAADDVVVECYAKLQSEPY